MNNIKQRVQTALNCDVTSIQSMHGGMVGEVYRIDFANQDSVVAKVAPSSAMLTREAYMLRYLRDHSTLPVPDVIYSDETLLIMTFIAGTSSFDRSTQYDAADVLADLHSVTRSNFGLEQDTLIGPIHQPNPDTPTWIPFFRDYRLLYTAGIAHERAQLPTELYRRIQHFADKLERYLIEPDKPSLIHGDIWATNVLALNGKITGFIDPAIYFGHFEMELAYITLFNTFGEVFFQHYNERQPITAGFFETRRHIYNLYPLLVHVTLFGGGYVGSVDGILRGFEC